MKKRIAVFTVCLMLAMTALFARAEEMPSSPEIGQVYWVDLADVKDTLPGTINSELPDQTLHWVPFLYGGEVDGYRLNSAEEFYTDVTAEPHPLLLAREVLLEKVSWIELDETGAVFGLPVGPYAMRCPSGGVSEKNPKTAEWTLLIYNLHLQQEKIPKTLLGIWAQDKITDHNGAIRALRGKAKNIFNFHSEKIEAATPSFCPVLEPVADELLRVVTVSLGDLTLEGEHSASILCVGDTFIVPRFEGLTGDTENLVWQDADGKIYAPGEAAAYTPILTAVQAGTAPEPPAELPQMTVQVTAENAQTGTVPTVQVTATGTDDKALEDFDHKITWYTDAEGKHPIEKPIDKMPAGTYYVQVVVTAEGYQEGISPLVPVVLTDPEQPPVTEPDKPGGTPDPGGETAADIQLDTHAHTFAVNETYTLQLVDLPAAAAATVQWRSTAPEIVSVQDGKVTARKEGVAAVLAYGALDADACVFTVMPEHPPVEYVEIQNSTGLCRLEIGQSVDLDAVIHPESTGETIRWTSNDESVVTVDQNGLVKAAGVGAAGITAEAGGKEAVCVVVVKNSEVHPQSIELDQTELILAGGQTYQLKASVLPEGAETAPLYWYSGNEAVAAVKDGLVTGVLQGETEVWAETADGLMSEPCTVTVLSDNVPPTDIALERTTLSVPVGRRALLQYRIAPQEAEAAPVTWASSDETVAVVSYNGVVTALAPGHAQITVSTENGLSATCTVAVSGDPLLPQKVTLDKTNLSLEMGQTARLRAQVEPENALAADILWESRDETVAVVEDGLVTAVLPGSTAVVARTANGRAAVCWVTVTQAQDRPPEDPDWPTEGLEGFVTRLYQVALERDPDADGFADWVRWLKDGTVDARSCAYGFIFSREMLNRNLTNREYLQVLYRVFMDRAPDAGGLNTWMTGLETGQMSREFVFDGFAYSVEFQRIKDSYGIG